MAVTIEYTGADGSPFPVTFQDEAQAARPWVRDVEHCPQPECRLMTSLSRSAGRRGTDRAYADAGIPPFPGFDLDGPDAHGWTYFVTDGMNDEFMKGMIEGSARLLGEHGTALGIWRELCLPKTKAAAEWLWEAGPDVPLEELVEREAYGMHMTMVPMGVASNDLDLMVKLLGDLHGDEARLVGYELTQGYESPTLDADHALWEIGQRLRTDADAAAALDSDSPAAAMAALRASGHWAEGFAAIDAYLARYGRRSEGWQIVMRTWAEQGDGFWCAVRQLSRPGCPSPRQALEEGVARRVALATAIEEKLADSPETLEKFRRRLGRLENYVMIREERALWQLNLIGALRLAFLRRGESMVEAGSIHVADDVLFLDAREVEAGGDLRSLVAERRAEADEWSKRRPPHNIGGESHAPAAAADGEDDAEVRGTGASRGIVTGRARVVVDLCDADVVEPGDVLVCRMTSPPWTPLFGIASAVVVDGGDMGSHAAIAAREYGIPCVIGTIDGTRRVPDGVELTVDGAAGVVRWGRR